MAITIQQAPTFPNIANNHLVYVVTSTQITQPQFQFVLDIKDADGNLVQRLKQQPNPSGKGVFDIGRLISQQFDDLVVPQYEDIQTWYNSPIVNANIWNQRYIVSYNNAGWLKEYNVYFGEEYGTSTTSVVTLYDGAGSPGNPSVTSTDNWQTYLGGTLDINGRYPIWDPDWNLISIYDSYGWVQGKYGISKGDNPLDPTLSTPGELISSPRMFQGKGKWLPQPFWAYHFNFNSNPDPDNYPQWNDITDTPPFPLYQFNVGLTKYPNDVKLTNNGKIGTQTNPATYNCKKPQKLYWDDAYSLSLLSGQPIPPENLDGTYMPPTQMFKDGLLSFKGKTSGWAPNLSNNTIPINRDWQGLYFNYKYWLFNSASLDYQMMHLPIGPNNLIGFQSDIKNPLQEPNDYTTEFEILIEGFSYNQAANYSGNPIAGSNRVGFDAPERGGVSFGCPMIFMDAAANPPGSYPSSTAALTLRSISGGDVKIHFTQSDFEYPGVGWPAASPLQIQQDINTQAAASGSSIRAYLIDNPTYEFQVDLNPEFANIPGSKYWLLLNEPSSTDDPYNSTTIHTLTLPGEEDALGIPTAGAGSGTGFGTGRYSAPFTGDFSLYLQSGSGADEYKIHSYWDRRRYEIDWDGYEQYVFANTIEDLKSCSGYKRRQFTWVNEYGAYDYFTFTLAESTTDNIERKDYKQTFVDFSSNTNTLNFDPSRRGKTQYQNKPVQNYTVESDWLNQEDADYLREMFFSTNVTLLEKVWQIGLSGLNEDYNFQASFSNETTGFGNFVNQDYPYQSQNTNITKNQVNPVSVVITNATITEKTNPRSQKMFRYTVEYQLANELRPRV